MEAKAEAKAEARNRDLGSGSKKRPRKLSRFHALDLLNNFSKQSHLRLIFKFLIQIEIFVFDAHLPFFKVLLGRLERFS